MPSSKTPPSRSAARIITLQNVLPSPSDSFILYHLPVLIGAFGLSPIIPALPFFPRVPQT